MPLVAIHPYPMNPNLEGLLNSIKSGTAGGIITGRGLFSVFENIVYSQMCKKVFIISSQGALKQPSSGHLAASSKASAAAAREKPFQNGGRNIPSVRT